MHPTARPDPVLIDAGGGVDDLPSPRLPADVVAALRRAVRGRLLFPPDLAFAATVVGHDRSVVHRPGVVVEIVDAEDAVAVVRVARDSGQPISVQLTGHGPLAVRYGGILVSTTALRTVEVRPGGRVRVGAGVRAGDLLDVLRPHGLAFPVGSSSGVGVVGYLLGGGIGPLGRSRGFGSDSVLALDVVTGDGHRRYVDREGEPELFWALRGGKLGLGLVTAVELQASPAPQVWSGRLVVDGDRAVPFLAAVAARAATVADTTTLDVGLASLPDDPGLPEPLRNRPVAVLQVCDVAATGEGQGVIKEFQEFRPLSAASAAGDLVDHLSAFGDDGPPTAIRTGSVLLSGFDGGAASALVEAWGRVGGHRPLVQLRQLGGALGPRDDDQGGAVGGREATHLVSVVVTGPDARQPRSGDTVTAIGHALRRWADAPGQPRSQANFATGGTAGTGLLDCWGPETARALDATRRRHDPEGLFRSRPCSHQ